MKLNNYLPTGNHELAVLGKRTRRN